MINTLFIFLVVVLIVYSLAVDIHKMINKKLDKSETITLFFIQGTALVLTVLLLMGIQVHMPTRFFIDYIAVPLKEWLKEQI